MKTTIRFGRFFGAGAMATSSSFDGQEIWTIQHDRNNVLQRKVVQLAN